MRVVTCALALTFSVGCSGPYHRKPDRLPRVKPSGDRVEAPSPPPIEVTWDDACSVRFNAAPVPDDHRDPVAAGAAADAGDAAIDTANRTDGAETQVAQVLAAIDAYQRALRADNYDADATYGLAVAYAMVRKKGCALEMLERLAELTWNPDLVGTAKLQALLGSVPNEPAFEPFEREALDAIVPPAPPHS